MTYIDHIVPFGYRCTQRDLHRGPCTPVPRRWNLFWPCYVCGRRLFCKSHTFKIVTYRR